MKNSIWIVLLIFTTSCSKSLIYNTGLNLPTKVVQKRDFDIQGNIGLFPEARPEAYRNQKNTTLGSAFQIQYGFSNNFNMALKGWADIQGREGYTRAGAELSAQINRPINTQNHLIIIPHAGIATGDLNIGYGLGTTFAFHTQVSDQFAYYIALGSTWGRSDNTAPIRNTLDEIRTPAGVAIHGNLGISYELTPNLRINAEINPIQQINTFDQTQQIFLAPQIGMGYTFRKETITN